MFSRGLVGVVAVGGALAFAAGAHAESIVYVDGGDIYLTDVERTVRLTTEGGYESPSQDAAGRIVAVRRIEQGDHTNRFLYRFDARGRELNDPVRAGQHDNSLFIGPLGAEVSPNGQVVAYHHFNHSPLIAENQRPRLSFGYTARDTDTTEIEDEGYYLNPTWIDNDRVAIFSDPAFNPDVQIYSLTGGAFTDWFGIEGAGLTSGDVSNDVTRFAVTGEGGAVLVLYSLDAPPPAAPTFRCGYDAPDGSYSSPVWSPDGKGLAWAEDDGIHLATVGDLAACEVREVALIPGGEAPFWGNAVLPAQPVVCAARIPAKVTRSKALRAIKVRIACPGAAKATGRARADGKTVATGSRALRQGEGTLAIRPTRRGKPVLRRVRSVRVRVNAGGRIFTRKVAIRG